MPDPLAAETLMAHVVALAGDIGPRPTGQPAEETARNYIRQALGNHGITALEEQPFQTRPTVGVGVIIPLAITLIANALGLAGRIGTLLGGALTLASAASVWRLFGGQRSFLELLEPKVTSANLIARIPPASDHRHTLVFMLGQVFQQALNEERHNYVAGANDNATAVACLLGLGAQFHAHPLRHTEIWLAFTGAEEVLCTGLHHLLDRHGSLLKDAWFIDFEMVGTNDIAYVTRHSGLSS
jgi:hypothetical protein